MRRNCNLELRLVTPSAALHPADFGEDGRHHRQLQSMLDLLNGSPNNGQKQQQLSIFYNGRVSVCDVTELQARAIIMHASREIMEEKLRSPLQMSTDHYQHSSPPLMLQSPSPSPSPLCSPNSGLSMTKSLQRFLQKRQNRIRATSPYHHH